MLENIKNGDLIITPNSIKNQILKDLFTQKKLLNIKFMTLKEFKDNYFGKYKIEALYFLMNKYNLNYYVVKEYLDNIFYNSKELKPYYDDLLNNNLIENNPLFKDTLKSIKVLGYPLIDPYLKEELNKYNTSYIDLNNNNYSHNIYGFDKQSDEIALIAEDIVKKLKEVDINDIYLINVNSDYKDEIKRIFNLFHLPINLTTNKNIYSTNTTSIFLKSLIKTKDLTRALENTPKNDIYNKIIDIINSLNIQIIDNISIEIIKNTLKETTIKTNTLKNAINIITLDQVVEDKYYYLLGFNQGIIPKIYQDNELIKDKDRPSLGLLTSIQKYKQDKNYTIKTLQNIKNLTITYKLKDNYNTYYPSPLIEELNIKPILNPKINYNYSNDYNKNILTKYLDNYLKFNEINPYLKPLLNTYDIPYKKYDNKYTGIDLNDLYNHLNNKLNLSYSSMNNYFNCAFKFYIQNILKLDPFEENFASIIGSLFHECLSKMYEDNFNLNTIYNNYLKDKKLTSKELFFTKKLYKDLEFVIETIKKQESHSKYNKVLTEEYIEIDKTHKLQIKFLGFVDKIKYIEEDSKILAAIIDYKTGSIQTNLDNINYGLNLQLPVYIYLTKNGLHKNIQITGFYLQKILNNKDLDGTIKDEENKLKLDGYTINNEAIIKKFDDTYEKSEIIKSMSITQKGFSSYAKTVSNDDIEKINNVVDKKIEEVINNVEEANFPINPKRIDNKLIGCDFCKFKDLCFRKEEDIVDLENTKFKDILNN